MGTREASHAGSWYSASGPALTAQLDQWLEQVPDELPGIGKIPLPRARAVISPHAGFAYSGPCAAWAYRCLDLSNAKRIFLLHPSHHHSLSTAALPVLDAYETPLSTKPLRLDKDLITELSQREVTTSHNRVVKFTTMSPPVDEAEHSGEMQLPYIHRLLQKLYPNDEDAYPPLVPIMIGSTSPATEAAIGKLLAPYIADKSNAFVISSDFCHWGSRFGYTYYVPDAPSPAIPTSELPNSRKEDESNDIAIHQVHRNRSLGNGSNLRSSSTRRLDPAIYESIAHVDRACMCAITTGEHAEFLSVLQQTGNTVCGRHPIGAFMAGVKAADPSADIGHFDFVRYERSNDVESVRDSSVSYVSGYAVL